VSGLLLLTGQIITLLHDYAFPQQNEIITSPADWDVFDLNSVQKRMGQLTQVLLQVSESHIGPAIYDLTILTTAPNSDYTSGLMKARFNGH
jgi:hypothetical protein